MSNYDDIINMQYRGSTDRKRMPMEARAAQFAPFAALTGHNAAINETARLTSQRIELTADEQARLSRRLSLAVSPTGSHPPLTFTFFQPDTMKSGGRYVTVTGRITKFDEFENIIFLSGNRAIKIDDIIAINGDIFND